MTGVGGAVVLTVSPRLVGASLWLPARSIATFAAPTPLSIAVAATTIALPVAALWLLWRALRSRAAGPATRTVAGVVALLLLFASVWLAGWGWIGLRTWTL